MSGAERFGVILDEALSALRNQLAMSVRLFVRDDLECLCVVAYTASGDHSMFLAPGDRPPLHCGPGLVLLAAMPEFEIDRYLSTPPAFVGTDALPEVVSMDVEWIRREGHLNQLNDTPWSCVSVPVVNAERRVVASLAAFAHRQELELAGVERVVGAVKDVSDQLTQRAMSQRVAIPSTVDQWHLVQTAAVRTR
jgi:DNA-binding IclR family transcriptional regulator